MEEFKQQFGEVYKMVASSGPYCEMHYYDRFKTIERRSMKQILKDQDVFIRISNSVAVRLSEIIKIEDYTVEIISGEVLTISKRRLNRTKRKINKAILTNNSNPNFLWNKQRNETN